MAFTYVIRKNKEPVFAVNVMSNLTSGIKKEVNDPDFTLMVDKLEVLARKDFEKNMENYRDYIEYRKKIVWDYVKVKSF